MSKLQLILTFEDAEELKTYIEDYEAVQLTKIKKLFKKTSDKRGSSTKTLHQRAKEYQKENPELTYKQSLQAVGNQIRGEKKPFQSAIGVSETAEQINETINEKI
jgi:hypothetical protein